MKFISAAQFKNLCLLVLDTLGPEGIVITKNGIPVAKLIPVQNECSSLIGSLKGKIRIFDQEIFGTGIKWTSEC